MIALFYIISFISVLLVGFYAFQLRKWRIAWRNEPSHVPSNDETKVSVIIPIHNELKHIDDLLLSLFHQFKAANELIFVCDNCTDGSEVYLKRLIYDRRDCKLIINNGKPGKKESQRLGVEVASNDIVIFLDADCNLPKWWIGATMSYHCKHRPDLLIAPVLMRGDGSVFQHLVELEFLALQMCTAGATVCGTPFMCNGANLSFAKVAYKRHKGNPKYASGDDMFLLSDIKKSGGSIAYLKSKDAVVTTHAPHNLYRYLCQRTRWLRKSTGYSDKKVISVALLVFLVNMSILALLALSVFYPPTTVALGIVFVVKLYSEYRLLREGARFWNVIVDFASVFLLALAYPLNVLLITILSIFRNPKRW